MRSSPDASSTLNQILKIPSTKLKTTTTLPTPLKKLKTTPSKKSKTTIMNKYDALNPLIIPEFQPAIGQRPHDKTKELPTVSAKAIKRLSKVTLEKQTQKVKEGVNAMDEKLKEINKTVNDNINQGLNKGFKEISTEIGNLTRAIKDFMVQKTNETNDHPTGRSQPSHQNPNIQQETMITGSQQEWYAEDSDFPLSTTIWTENQDKKPNEDAKPTENNQEKHSKQQEQPEERTKQITKPAEQTDDDNTPKLTLQNLQDQINHLKIETKQKDDKNQTEIQELHEKIRKLEGRNNTNDNGKPTRQTNQPTEPKPALEISLSGKVPPNQQPRDHPQPLDFTKVTTAWKKLPPKQNLSNSTHQEVKHQLQQHNDDIKHKIENNEIKLKKPTKISTEQKEKMIENMFTKQACTIGIAPISNEHVSRVCADLTRKGIIKKSEPLKTRQE